MSGPSYDGFIASIKATLAKNGFPERRVSLPLERMYEVAYNKQLNFNKALTSLESEGISHTKEAGKIIFFDASRAAAVQEGELAEMMAKAGAILQGLTPDQLAELRRTVEGLSDADKERMMQQAQELGLKPPGA